MFAEKLSPLIARHPQEADALERMKSYLQDFEDRRGAAVLRIRLDPNVMFDIMQAGTSYRLTRLISILVSESILKRQLVVRFPSGAGITFNSYSEIPSTVRDPVQDVEVEVSTDNVEPSYILVSNENC
ncbi:hypothetical protein [Pseudomonas qingdaonensis]|uniref:hypothetical protein n=1 Tax=Pseudomonas qingdaonensis TaxID=2056231 RepID=UPI001F0BFEA6|nr:hypothetical protein [Pseudomonas qingdaonensis]